MTRSVSAGRVVECLYCGHRIDIEPGAQMEPILAAARAHDQACEANPLAVELRRLRAKNEELGAALAPYAAVARMSTGMAMVR